MCCASLPLHVLDLTFVAKSVVWLYVYGDFCCMLMFDGDISRSLDLLPHLYDI